MIPELPMTNRIDSLSLEYGVDRLPVTFGELDDEHAGPESMQLPTDRMVGLRFLKAALWRQRQWWLAFAVVGLLAGVLYHVAVPMKYEAVSTVYLVHPSNVGGTVGAQDDLAMLGTDGVADRALAALHEPGLTPPALLGKLPGTLLADDVLEITVYGPSPDQAIRRVDALTSAYLGFRSEQYRKQNQAVVDAADSQMAKLRSEISALSVEISAGSSGASGSLANLESEQAAALNQLTGLKTAVQQDDLNELAVTQGTKVLAKGTLVPSSKKKVYILDGLTGLAAGLGGSVLVLAALAMLSDRTRRREDIAAILGAPVALSVGRIGNGSPLRRRSVLQLAASPDASLWSVVTYLRGRLPAANRRATQLVVAVDDHDASAAAMLALAGKLCAEGTRVVVVDATEGRSLGRALGQDAVGAYAVDSGNGLPELGLIVAPLPGEDEGPRPSEPEATVLASAKVTLVLGSVDPALGAWHLRAWSNKAIVTVSAGRSTAQRIAATAELLEAAGVTVDSAVLFDTDRDDDSVGIPLRGDPVARRVTGASPQPAMSR
jgi:Chain length determinant protein